MIASSRGLPAVIGHRGAPGYRPEHTRASFLLALDLGADAIEPDLVSTRDGVLVVRHENEIGRTTDVADHPEFAARRTTRTVGPRTLTGWFTEDFTLAELKTLRAVERIPGQRPRNVRWDRRFEVITFDELLLMLAEERRRRARAIGLVVELKASSYFASIGLGLEDAMLSSLRDHGLDHRDSGVCVESFETANLRRLRERTDLPLVQLIEDGGSPADRPADRLADRLADRGPTYDDLCTPAGLRAVARYADGVSVAKRRLLRTPGLVERAHLAGLSVLAWTIRDDEPGLGAGGSEAEVRRLLDAGVDGLFADQPDTALLARDDWAGRLSPAL